MARPHIAVHVLGSVDGRLDGFPPDVGLYYEVAASIPHQAVLSGSGTLVAAAEAEGVDLAAPDLPTTTTADPPPPAAPAAQEDAGHRPWLVVVDSRGRLSRVDWLRAAAHWRDVVVLCSAGTPPEHRQRLEQAGVSHEVVGDDRVDLAAALDVLAEGYGVTDVRVDAGPTLIGALLRAGLVDEVSVVVAPYVVGGAGDHPLRLLDVLDEAGRLRLLASERLRDDHVLLRYAVAP